MWRNHLHMSQVFSRSINYRHNSGWLSALSLASSFVYNEAKLRLIWISYKKCVGMWRRHKNGHYQHCIISRENNQHQLTGDIRSPGWGEAKIEHNNSDEYQCEGPSSPRLTSKMLLCAKSIKKNSSRSGRCRGGNTTRRQWLQYVLSIISRWYRWSDLNTRNWPGF